MDYVARYVGVDDETLLKTWSVQRYYTKLRYLAHVEFTKKEYAKIMQRKQN